MYLAKPHYIFFIGCGGTGSNLVPWLYNLVQSNLYFFNRLEKTIFIDPDTVSNQNLQRQNFLPWMTNKSKSLVFAKVYEQSLKTENFAIASNEESLERIFSHFQIQPTQTVWFICCPDNTEARRSSLEFLKKKVLSGLLQNYFWISPGNDDSQGTIGSHLVQKGTALSTDPLVLFPNWAASNEFQGLRDDASYGCGGDNESGIQHFVLNGLAAIHTANILAQLVEQNQYIPSAWFSGGTTPTIEYAQPIDLHLINLEKKDEND